VDQTAVTVTVTINGTNDATGDWRGEWRLHQRVSGWMTIGLPTLSGGQAHLQSGGGSQQINATAMEAFFLSNTGQAIDIPDSTANASGQAIMQKVLLADANATTARVSFQWAFDAPGGTNSNDDFAFYVTAAGSNRVVEIWSVQTGQPNGYLVSGSMDHNGSIIGTGMTGGDSLMMRTSTFEVSGITGGEFYLGFGIMDWQNGGTSVLTLDNIQIIA
jgi:hypothetical protein